MSQHYFVTTYHNAPVTVTLGWDRPLGHFFMTIEKEDAAEKESEFLYSYLDENDSFGKTLQYFKNKLEEFSISVPKVMFSQIESDKRLNIGDRYVHYSQDGIVVDSLAVKDNHATGS